MHVRDVEVQGTAGSLILAVAEAGVGGRPLVLLHGFTGAKEDFTEWLDPLADLGWHVVVPDQRGHGDSSKPDAEASYSFAEYTADLLALLDALGWSKVVALGHSMGGMVLQTAALKAPERFTGLILMNTSHRVVLADEELVDLAIGIARMEGMAALLAAQDALAGDRVVDSDVDRRLKAERPGYKEFGDRKMLGSSPAMYAAMIKALTDAVDGVERIVELAGLTVPTLVIVGEHDRPFVQPSQRIAAAIPNSELVVIPNAAHAPQFENPDPWWKAIRAFLERV